MTVAIVICRLKHHLFLNIEGQEILATLMNMMKSLYAYLLQRNVSRNFLTFKRFQSHIFKF